MKAVVQKEASGVLYIEEVDIPIPGSGEVLIRMEYSPINPSDLSFLQGTYAVKPSYPITPGIEGSGTVVAAGKGLLPKMRLNKRVSCTSTKGKGGTWAEYMVTSVMHVIPIGDLDFKQASMLIVNPLTALSFIDIAKSSKHQAIVNNAASGALGKMIGRLADNSGISCINIVRSEKQCDNLKSLGFKHVLNHNNPNFNSDYKRVTNDESATLILDPVGGQQAVDLLKQAPNESVLMCYANLSGNEICIDSRVLVQENKQIEGFYLADYSSQKSMIKSLRDSKKVQKLIGIELSSDIQKVVPLDNVNDAIELYKTDMSKGKVLIQCINQ